MTLPEQVQEVLGFVHGDTPLEARYLSEALESALGIMLEMAQRLEALEKGYARP